MEIALETLYIALVTTVLPKLDASAALLFLMLEERTIVNLFQFLIANKMTILVFILDLTSEGLSAELIVLVV